MPRLSLAFIALVFAGSASGASNCDAILSQIDTKIRASGVSRFTLTTVDADAIVTDKVVGTCDLGTKKIVYAQGDLPASPPNSDGSASGARPSPPQPRSEPILTECKDGSVSVGGDCKK
ncbi:DUF1161 domain-containing protein [Variovorax sp. LjRoot290]|uniref:DUF1161 domain-containing protein n=1 Tax=unclassified Variovorax TaxID=663243 RepID=UPI003ECF570C